MVSQPLWRKKPILFAESSTLIQLLEFRWPMIAVKVAGFSTNELCALDCRISQRINCVCEQGFEKSD
jgi:hypothetical protein